MNTKDTTSILAALLAALAVPAQGQSYEITNLGRLAGPSQAYALNAAGRVTGGAIAAFDDGSPFRAFTWDGALHEIEPLVHEHQCLGFAIDDAGAVYGTSFTIGRFRTAAFISQAGAPVYLGEFSARDANNLGVVVGVTAAADAAGWRTTSACVLTGANLSTLPGLGGLSGAALAIADSGDIAGFASLPGDQTVHAVLWRSDSAHDLGTLGGPRSQALAVNNFGLVAGFADTVEGSPHACIFETDAGGNVVVRHDLGVLGGRSSIVLGLNDAGEAVGASDDRAFLWDDGRLIDLNSLIDPGSGWRLEAAAAINGRDQIVGWGRLLGVPTAYLLTRSCRADFNNDGVVDTRDVITFLNEWAAGDESADLDGNGIVDTRDVIAFMNLWASGC